MDHSAAYLSVACLGLVSPLSEEEKCPLINGSVERWGYVLYPEEEQETQDSFTACMALIHREARIAPPKYPMTPNGKVRIAAALPRLVAWDTMYPKVRLNTRSARQSLAQIFLQNIHPSVKVVRPLIFGLMAARHWIGLARKTTVSKAGLFVNQYKELNGVGLLR